MALEPQTSPVRDDAVDRAAAALTDARPEPESAPSPGAAAEDLSELERKKVFQAFNIKPLRQKLPTPADLDELHKKWAEPDGGTFLAAVRWNLIRDCCRCFAHDPKVLFHIPLFYLVASLKHR